MINAGIPTRTDAEAGQSGALFSRQHLLPFFLVTALFFLWGIPNNLNDVLIRQFMKSFELSRFQAGLVQSAFYFGYFVMAIPAALLMRRFGYKTGLIFGLLLFSAGTFLFWPAALNQSYGFFLFALFVIASGLAFLETGANPFVAQLGEANSAARRLNFSQAFNPLGAITGVFIGTTFIFSGLELSPTQVSTLKASGQYEGVLRAETMRVITPYLVLGAVVLIWALLIARTRFPQVSVDAGDQGDGGLAALFRFPHFLLAVLGEFFYVGAQVGTWSYFIQYVQDYAHQTEKIAGYFLTGTLVAFAAGRFSATYLMRYVEPSRLMAIYAMANIVLVGIGILQPGWVGLWAIFLTSFFMSLMFPTIFALGLRGLGNNTKLGGSMLVMGVIGGAVITPIMGLVAGQTKSMAEAMVVPLLCYVYIALFASFGAKLGLRENETSAHLV